MTIFSIGRKDFHKATFLARLNELAKRHGLSKSIRMDATKPSLVSEEEMARWVCTPEELTWIKENGFLPGKPKRIEFFRKSIPLKVFDFKAPDDTVVFSVEFAEGNKYPMLSKAVWTRKLLGFPIGMVTINVKDDRKGRSILRFIRKLLKKRKYR